MKKYTILTKTQKEELYLTYCNRSITQERLAALYGIATITCRKIIKKFRDNGIAYPVIWN